LRQARLRAAFGFAALARRGLVAFEREDFGRFATTERLRVFGFEGCRVDCAARTTAFTALFAASLTSVATFLVFFMRELDFFIPIASGTCLIMAVSRGAGI